MTEHHSDDFMIVGDEPDNRRTAIEDQLAEHVEAMKSEREIFFHAHGKWAALGKTVDSANSPSRYLSLSRWAPYDASSQRNPLLRRTSPLWIVTYSFSPGILWSRSLPVLQGSRGPALFLF